MSGRLLDFKSYVGGADAVVVEEVFPNTSKTYTYQFGTDTTTWTFGATYQTLVADVVTYDRNTGLPNFTETNITGFFGNPGAVIPLSNINNNGLDGSVNFTIPAGLYTGPIIPSARINVPMTVVTFTWTNPNGSMPDIVESHRWCLMQRWESSVSPADPILDPTYTPLGTGALLTFSDNSATDTNRVAGSYTVTGLSNKEGTGATFSVEVSATGVTSVNITSRGAGYNVGDTVELLDVNMGKGGGADITITVSTVA